MVDEAIARGLTLRRDLDISRAQCTPTLVCAWVQAILMCGKMALQRDPVVSRALAATDKNSGTTEVATGVRPDRKHGK